MHPPNGIASIACSASRPEPTAASLPPLRGFVDFSFKSAVMLRRPLRSDTHRPRLRTGLSRQANRSLSVGTKSAGKGFARARDRAAFCTRKLPSPAAETGNASPTPAKVAEHRGFFERPQEIVFVRGFVDFSFKSTVTLRRPLRSDTHRPRLRTGLSRQANPSLSVGTKSYRERVCASQRPSGILPPQTALARSRDRKRL